jgi:hypothetical protein
MKVEDYYTEGRRAWFHLHENGMKRHDVPAHHNAEDYLVAKNDQLYDRTSDQITLDEVKRIVI